MTKDNASGSLMELEGVHKTFGNVVALTNVSLDFPRGEVIGLLGDNGAGKSTLIKVLSGVHQPDRGEVFWEGRPLDLSSPRAALDLGISVAYQDLAVVQTMSIYRNLFLGREEHIMSAAPFRFLRRRYARELASDVLSEIGIRVRDVDQPVGTLSGGERQSIAIARATYFKSSLLILDEPTSALSIKETDKVLSYVAEARSQGVTVVLITHNIYHAFQVSDRFAVLYHGTVAGTFARDEVSRDDLATLITTGQLAS